MKYNLLTIIFFASLLINVNFVIASGNVYSMPIDLPTPIPDEQKIPIPNQTNKVVPIEPGNLTVEIPSIEVPNKIIRNITIDQSLNQSVNATRSLNYSGIAGVNISLTRNESYGLPAPKMANVNIINVSEIKENTNYTGTASAKPVEGTPAREPIDLSNAVKVNSTEIRVIRSLKSDGGPLKDFIDVLKEISNFMRNIFGK